MKIALIDGSEIFRRQVSELLHDIPGATVVCQAEHEDVGVLTVGLCAPDVVLLDLTLTSGSGQSVLKRLRRAGYTGTIYVVSACDETEHGPRCGELGADGFYDKQYDLHRLMTALNVLATAPRLGGQARLRIANLWS